MPTIAIVGVVIGAIILVVLLLQLWAKAHTRNRASQVWAQIERVYGPQRRSDWVYASDPASGTPMTIAVSKDAFFMIVVGQVARLPWTGVEKLAISPEGTGSDVFALTGAVEMPGKEPAESGQVFNLNVPGQTAYPIKHAFLEALVKSYEAARIDRG